MNLETGAYDQSDLVAIRLAIRSGKRSVAFGDRTTTFHSAAEMIAIERRIINELNRGVDNTKQFTAIATKGLER